MSSQSTARRAARGPSVPPAPRALYLGAAGREVFGLLHEPAGAPRGAAVLICPPFGNSDNGSYMPRRTWAQRLALAGHPVLRFDLPGTGDSPGSPHDPGTVERWIEATSSCAAWLRGTYGLRTAAIGLGLGGLIASLAADGGAPIDDLVLWAVPSRGRQFLRELRMFEAMLAARVYNAQPAPSGEANAGTGAEGDAPPASGHDDGHRGPAALPAPRSADGSLESAGFILSAESVAALRTVDLGTLTPGGGAGRRVMLLERDGMGLEERLDGALRRWGAEVESAAGPGFWQMMAAPYESVAPETVMATVDRWLQRGPARPATGVAATRPTDRTRVRIRVGDAEIDEFPFVIEHASGRLLAIATEPLAPDAAQPTLVLVNSGTLRRVGPNRMWVELARRWSARGLRAVRFDLSRESDLSPEVLGRFHPAHSRPGDMIWDHFDGDFAQQYRAVIDHLREHGHNERFILAGLSSGAYWSLNHLREDDRILAAGLINCSALRWNLLLGAQNDVAKLRSWATWRRLLRGEIPVERLLHGAQTAAGLLLGRARRRPAPGTMAPEADEVDLLLEQIGRADQHLTFLFGAGEPLHRQLEVTGRLEEFAASPRVTIEYLQSHAAAHTLESVELQRAAHATLDRTIERALASARAATTGGPSAVQPASR